MKKSFYAFTIFILFTLTACTGKNIEQDPLNKSTDALISPAEMTSYEEVLTKLMADQVFYFDIERLGEQLTELRATVELYEHGHLISSVIDFTTMLSDTHTEEGLRIIFTQQLFGEDQERWKVATISESGHSSGSNTLQNVTKLSMSSNSSVGESVSIAAGEKRVVASIIQTNNNHISNINIETAEDLRKATDYEKVYILSIQVNE